MHTGVQGMLAFATTSSFQRLQTQRLQALDQPMMEHTVFTPYQAHSYSDKFIYYSYQIIRETAISHKISVIQAVFARVGVVQD